jgi:hypothetical protein
MDLCEKKFTFVVCQKKESFRKKDEKLSIKKSIVYKTRVKSLLNGEG